MRGYAVAMGLLQIRDVPEESRRELKARAAARGMSLNSYLLELVRSEVEHPTVEQVLTRAAARGEHLEESVLELVQASRRDRQ